MSCVSDGENINNVKSAKDPGGVPLSNGHCDPTELVNGISDLNYNGVHDEEDSAIEKGEVEANEKGSDKKDEPEVVFIQDMGFTVKIVSPGTEAFDIQVYFVYDNNGFSYCYYCSIRHLPSFV